MRARRPHVLVLASCLFVTVITGTAPAARVPHGVVAVVVGRVITERSFDHWLFVATKENASAAPGTPVIVPRDPPGFARCIATVRRKFPKLAKLPASQLRADCRQLFESTAPEVMDFLIKSRWYEAEARVHDLEVSRSDVLRTYRKDKRDQFPTRAAFRRFLRESGQTVSDILFRVRINLIYTALLRRLHIDGTELDRRALRDYRPATWCARQVLMRDCANARRRASPSGLHP